MKSSIPNNGALGTLCGLLASILVAQSGCSSPSSTPAPATPDAVLQNATGVPWDADRSTRTGVPDLVAPTGDDPPPILVPGVTPEQAARQFLTQFKSIWRMRDATTEMITRDVDLDEEGMTHVLFDQTSNGVPVLGAGLFVHFGSTGSIAYVNGDYFPDLAELDHTPKIDKAGAIAAAAKDAGAGFVARGTPDALLGIDGYNSARPTLVWQVKITGTDSKGARVSQQVFVDAQTAAVFARFSLDQQVSASGRGTAGNVRNFQVTSNTGGKSWTMTWPTSATASVVSTSQRLADGTNAVITSTDLKSWDPIADDQPGAGAASDVHLFAHLVDQFYRTKELRKSYDGNGSPFDMIVHDNSNGAINAFWSYDTNDMHFGDGDPTITYAITQLDVTGHELTHGVTSYTSKLAYHFQPGALNESISDIFGSLIEHEYQPGAGNMLIGEGTLKDGNAIRDMGHPSRFMQPDNMASFQKFAESNKYNDYGGVHANSGIPNNAFYLMALGGANDTSKIVVPGSLGWDGARKVWWQSERHALNAESDFSQTARAQIASAKQLHQSRKVIACSWVAVGVVDAAYAKQFGITCGCDDDAGETCMDEGGAPDGGSPVDVDGGAPASDGASPEADLEDSCTGRADGVYCSTLAPYAAIVCSDGSIAGGQQCQGANQTCIGPNGAGTTIQCQ
jgi:Zn-dependent metalloprotease